MVEAALERLKDCFDKYAEWDTSSQVVSTEFSMMLRFEHRPLYFKRFGGRSNALKQAPDPAMGYHENGLDAQGRIVHIRQYHGYYPPVDTFFRYSENMIEAVMYVNHIPAEIKHYFMEAGKITRCVQLGINGYNSLFYQKPSSVQALVEHIRRAPIIVQETYQYEGERLTRIDSYRGFDVVQDSHYQIDYDDQGEIILIMQHYNEGGSSVLFRKRPKGETLASITEAAKAALLKAIPQVIKAQNFTEPIYCLVLGYNGVEQYFPPVIEVGFLSEREAILKRDRHEWSGMWYPILNKTYSNDTFPPYRITDPDVLAACEKLETEIQQASKFTHGTKALRQIAHDLTQLDWSQITPTTDDFVVYAIDYELDEIDSALRASTSPEQVKAWRKKGWL